jgi:hypothetical protein
MKVTSGRKTQWEDLQYAPSSLLVMKEYNWLQVVMAYTLAVVIISLRKPSLNMAMTMALKKNLTTMIRNKSS